MMQSKGGIRESKKLNSEVFGIHLTQPFYFRDEGNEVHGDILYKAIHFANGRAGTIIASDIFFGPFVSPLG